MLSGPFALFGFRCNIMFFTWWGETSISDKRKVVVGCGSQYMLSQSPQQFDIQQSARLGSWFLTVNCDLWGAWFQGVYCLGRSRKVSCVIPKSFGIFSHLMRQLFFVMSLGRFQGVFDWFFIGFIYNFVCLKFTFSGLDLTGSPFGFSFGYTDLYLVQGGTCLRPGLTNLKGTCLSSNIWYWWLKNNQFSSMSPEVIFESQSIVSISSFKAE